MKKKQPLRRFEDIAGVKLVKHISNKTPLHMATSHMVLECPICGISFTRKASEAKRNNVNYCGKACAGVGCRKQVMCACRICGTIYTVKHSQVGSVTCCGDECRRKAISVSSSAFNVKAWKNGVFGRGERSVAAKLTSDQVRYIRSDKRNNAELARYLGVTRATIRNIRIGKTWGKT